MATQQFSTRGRELDAGSLVDKAQALAFRRTTQIVIVTGLIALIAGFRLATNGEAVGEEMLNDWLVQWALIWAALAGLGLWLLQPVLDFLANDRKAYDENQMLRQLIKLEPSMAQELRAMEMFQQGREEAAAEEQKAKEQSLEVLGGLRANPVPVVNRFSPAYPDKAATLTV